MMKATCKYITIDEISDLISPETYLERRIVNPIDYLFSFEKGVTYTLFGFGGISGILYVYIISNDNSYEIESAPAVLFECDWSKLPENWRLRFGKPNAENFEIVPEKLALVDHWFEKYIDEDPLVLELVKSEIDKIRNKDTSQA